MKKKIIKAVLIGMTCFVMLTTSGCFWLAVGAVGAGAVAGTAFVLGKLTGTVSGTLEQVKEASVKALADLKIAQTKSNFSDTEAAFDGVDPDGDSVSLTIHAKGTEKCEVQIRFGTFGDKEKSSALYNKIVELLSK